MSTPRYIIAQYIPDRVRQEAKNIGVIVWTPSGIHARFQGEDPQHPGRIDGRSVSNLVGSTKAYKQWVEYWRHILGKGEVRDQESGKTISSDSGDFLKAITSTGKGNYRLIDGGSMMDSFAEEETDRLVRHLYTRIVDSTDSEAPSIAVVSKRAQTATDYLKAAIDHAGMRHHAYFKTRYEIPCRITEDVQENLTFSYAYANGEPKRLYEWIPFLKTEDRLRRDVYSSMFKFERVMSEFGLQQRNCVSVVYFEEGRGNEPAVQHSLELLDGIGTVVNVRNHDQVKEEMSPDVLSE